MLFSDSTYCSPPSSPPSPPSPSSTWNNSTSSPSSPVIEPLCLDDAEDQHELTRQTRLTGVTDPLAGSYNAKKSVKLSLLASGWANKRRRVELQSCASAAEIDVVEVSKDEDKMKPKPKEDVEAIWEKAGVRVFETGNGEIDLMDRKLTSIPPQIIRDLSKMVVLPAPRQASDDIRDNWSSTRTAKGRTFARIQTEPAYAGTRYSDREFYGKSLSSGSIPNPTSLKFFLANNLIRRLPCELWILSNLTVLSLRNNNISYLPPEIEQLESLVELNVARNNLKYIPAEMTKMKNLETLILFPNPFKTPPSTPGVCPVSNTKFMGSRVPLLSELILRSLVSRPVPGDFTQPRKTVLEECAVLPLATGHNDQPIADPLGRVLATCVPGSVIVDDDGVEEFDEDGEPKFVTGIGRCLSPRHHGHRPIFVRPLEVRYTWESKIAGIDLGVRAALRWRGCHRGCLDFLGPATEEELRAEANGGEIEEDEIVQTVRFDSTEPLGFDD